MEVSVAVLQEDRMTEATPLAEALAGQFPTNSLVRLTASEYKNWEGIVTGVEQVGYVAYVKIDLAFNAMGKRLEPARPVRKRKDSLVTIDEYTVDRKEREKAAEAQPAAA